MKSQQLFSPRGAGCAPLLVNLAFVFAKPTGISTYATSLFPYLQSLEPTLLVAQDYPNYQCYPIPGNLTPEQGRLGHLRRLLWTQFQLPRIYEKLGGGLLFSPVAEMPLYSDILPHQIKDYGVGFLSSRIGIPDYSLTGFRL